MKKSEIWIVAYIYSIICFIIYFGIEEHKSKKLYQDFYQAKVIAVELYDENEALHQGHKSLNEAVESLNIQLNKSHKMERLVEDLATVPRDRQKLVLSVCYNESNLLYDLGEHKGKKNKNVFGICGVNLKIWSEIIPEINKDNVDSLYAGHLVLSYLIDEEKGNILSALKSYKGTVDNYFPIIHTLEIKKRIEL